MYIGLTYQDKIMKPTMMRFLTSAAVFVGPFFTAYSLTVPKTQEIESKYSLLVISNSVSVSVSEESFSAFSTVSTVSF